MIRIAEVIVVASLLMGCSGTAPDLVVGGRSISIDAEEKTDARRERVIEVKATQRLPVFAELDQDMEENLIEAGSQTSQKLCGGPSELTYKTVPRVVPRSLLMRFRCT